MCWLWNRIRLSVAMIAGVSHPVHWRNCGYDAAYARCIGINSRYGMAVRHCDYTTVIERGDELRIGFGILIGRSIDGYLDELLPDGWHQFHGGK